MAKLVVLSAALSGQSYELKVDRTTVGRVDDNTFQIAQPSVSSHHCEILLRGNDVVVKDLNSTNGTFIDDKPVTSEAVLKPGQKLRLGEIELRLDSGDGTVAPETPGSSTARRPSQVQTQGSTMVINKGVNVDQLGTQTGSIDTKGVFTKKKNKTNQVFIGVAVVLLLVIVGAVLYLLSHLGKSGAGH